MKGSGDKIPEEIVKRSDYVISKASYSPGSEIVNILKDKNIQQATIVGIDTDGCVLSTMYTVFDAGIETFVDVLGCASTGGKEIHNSAIQIIKRSFGTTHVLHDNV